MASSSFDETTFLYSRFLRLIAILPFEGRSLASPASLLLLVYFFVSSCLHWYMLVHYTLTVAGVPTIDAICETVFVVGMEARYYLLLRRRLEFADLLAECRDIWEMVDEEDRSAVRYFEGKVRRLFLAMLGSCVFILFAYGGSAIALNLEAAARISANETEDPQRFLPYKWYASGAEDTWPGYKFNYVLQIVVALNSAAITASVDSAAPLLIMLAAGYCRVVRRRLHRAYELAMKSDSHESAQLELLACCRLHQRILNFCTRINDSTQALFFVQLASTGYNSSLFGIKLAGTDPDKYKYVPLGLLNISQMFICQWAPDYLVDESTAIATAAYNASFPWMRRRVGKLLVLMVGRAQRPVQMTAAGVVYLSLENFGAMLKGALSFFTVLRGFNV